MLKELVFGLDIPNMIQILCKPIWVIALGALLFASPAPSQVVEDVICGLPETPVAYTSIDHDSTQAPEQPGDVQADPNPNATHSEHGHQAHQRASGPVTGTPLDFFTNGGNYMPRTHCLADEAGNPDWPWIIALLVMNATVIAGYLRIFVFWRRAYLDEAPEDRNKKMMKLAYIFLFCAVCGYAFSIMAYFWPAYRLLAVMMVILNVVTWGFALNLKDFRLSLSANRLQRELEEELKNRNDHLEALVAERTAILERVKEQTRQLALVASKTDNIVVITDIEGSITWVNASFTRVTGYTMDEAIGNKPGQMLQGPETDPQTVQRIREAIAKREPIREEILNYTKDGRPYWLDIEIQPIRDEDGNVTHFMAMESDITDDKKINEELTRAKEEAESGNRSKSQFIANMSHEIRTPLTGIIGFADMLSKMEDVDAATRRDWGHTILSSSRHLQALLNDVLDISKIEAGKLEIETMQVSPHEVIAEIASIFRVNAQAKGLSLELACPNPLPKSIQTDPTRLKQILSNLVGNAIKFTSEGSIRIEADLVKHSDYQDELMRIDIVDTGPGMSKEQLSRLFQAFAQADASVTRKFGGTGLGLAISRNLAEALGGGLTVESREGFGSRFILTIDPGDISDTPRIMGIESHTVTDQTEQILEQTETSSSVSVDSDSNTPKSDENLPEVLLADDGETNRKFITTSLKHAGIAVTAVPNGKVALDTLVAEPDRFKLVLMDMQMPEMDGFEATRQARKAGVKTPIFALTASVLKGDRERCLSVGCNDYLSKPIEPARLIEAVKNVLAMQQEAQLLSEELPQPVTKTTGSDKTNPPESEPIISTLEDETPGLIDLITSYANELSQYLEEADHALNSNDVDTVAKLAHKILGSGGMMGFDCLSDPAEALEQAALSKKLDKAAEELEELKQLSTRIQHGANQLNKQIWNPSI